MHCIAIRKKMKYIKTSLKKKILKEISKRFILGKFDVMITNCRSIKIRRFVKSLRHIYTINVQNRDSRIAE